jgi:hypothetical protein
LRRVRYKRGWWAKFNSFPPETRKQIGEFLHLACNNPYDSRVIGPGVTRVDGRARCQSTLASGYRVLWTIGSYENQEVIDLYDVLPPE